MASTSYAKQGPLPMKYPASGYNPYPAPLARYEDVVASPNLFMSTLENLHAAMSTKFMIPIIGGKELDLHRLFVEVTSRGGLEKVVRERRWKEVTSVFNFPSTATNASFVLRKYYGSLLHHYEQLYFFKARGWTTTSTDSFHGPSITMVPTQGAAPPSIEIHAASVQHPRANVAQSASGSPVIGVIDGKFESGYLVTVTIGSERLKGVLYEVPQSIAPQMPHQYNVLGKRENICPATGVQRRRRRKKSEIKRRDPAHPKPNRSGYNFFFAEQHAILKPLHPGKDREISRMIGEMWNKLKESEKAVYQEKALKDKERYRLEMEGYRERLRTGQVISDAVPIQQLPEPNQDMMEADVKLDETEGGGSRTPENESSSGESDSVGDKNPDKDLAMEVSPGVGVATESINLDAGNSTKEPTFEAPNVVENMGDHGAVKFGAVGEDSFHELHNLKQERGESITSFYAKMETIWDQLALSEPTFNDTADIGKYIEYHDKMRLIQFLMALTDDFEPCRASLLHQPPLPTLDSALSRLLSDETHLGLLKPQRDTTMAAAINKFPLSKRGQKYCRHCNKYGHALYECSLVECHKCKQKGHIAPNCTSLPQRSDQWKTQSKPNQSIVTQNKSPYECLYGILPAYDFLKIFGCACFVLLPSHEHHRLKPRARLCCFLGYGIQHKGYRCWDPVSQKLCVSHHVVFWEHTMFASLSEFKVSPFHHPPIFTNPSLELFPNDDAGSPNELSNDQTSMALVSEDVSFADIAPRTNEIENPPVTSSSSHPTQVRNPPTYLQDYHCFFALTSLHEPQSYKEASLDPLWQQAMKEELQALEKTGTWDLVDLPPDKTLVGCKWVYKIKTHSDGSVEHYKARLVAKGFTQEYGIDYEETFAPVARLTTVRSLLAIAAVRKWKLFQMDVKNAFLNGDLEEDVYMKPPPGLTPSSNKVCRLQRALYGLKQSPRAWFTKFSSTVSEFGFTSSPHDTALFVRKSTQGMVLLLIYVDDMIITGDDVSRINELKQFLSHRFEMKDLGSLSYFLGLEVTSSDAGYLLSQMKYASDLISKADLTDSKNVSTPLEPNVKLTPLDGSPLPDPTRYRQLVGSLVYLTTTRPDIAYAVHVVSQFMAAPRSTHYAAVLRIVE
ncbi:hypothetical protein SLEP1_g37711 [Rubroshorea leprosula]|nr:hypothetical protein SLEP1_g37711 [Rubroshorea leprosula]